MPRLNRWTNEEVIFLKENYGKMTDSQIAEKLNRSSNSVFQKRLQLDPRLKKTKKMIEVEQKSGKPIDVILNDLYIKNGKTRKEVEEILGLADSTIVKWFKTFGIKIKTMSEIKKLEWAKRDKKRVLITKKCKECGEKFEVFPCERHQQHCSLECYWKSKETWSKKILQCKNCGRKFKVKSAFEVRRKYCSKICALEAMRKALKGRIPWNKDRIIRTCVVCGKEFEITRKSSKKYCSHKCYTLARLKFRKYGQPNNNLFKKWGGDMAYILGYTYADGCIYKPRRKKESNLLIFISKDKELLEKVREKITKGYPLYIHKPTEAWQLRINSNEIVSDLEKLGITERKTPVKQFPEVLQEYLADFIRGYFDGDGSISVYRTRQDGKLHLGCSIISGSREFLEKLDSILKTNGIGIDSNVTQPPSVSKGAFILCYGTKNAMKFCKFIYSGKSDLKMERKYKKYIDFISRGNKPRRS